MNKENFVENYQQQAGPINLKSLSKQQNNTFYIETPEPNPFCNDTVTIDPPSVSAVSVNQKLTGNTSHPVTKINPVVIAPSHDLEYWRDNNLITHSAINSNGAQQDMYLSGYGESNCCGYIGRNAELVPDPIINKYPNTRERIPEYGIVCDNQQNNNNNNNNDFNNDFNNRNNDFNNDFNNDSKENYCSYYGNNQIRSPVPVQDKIYLPTLPIENYERKKDFNNDYNNDSNNNRNNDFNNRNNDYNNDFNNDSKENYCSYYGNNQIRSPVPVQDKIYLPTLPIENYERKKDSQCKLVFPELREYSSGDLNQTCGYNPMQIYTSDLPSNYPAGNCQQDPRMKQFNRNLYTEIVTPGVYTRNQINEPINSNIGISFQQQFEPVSCEQTDKGLVYTQHDPRVIDPSIIKPPNKLHNNPRYDNVYDPRFYGYGTSYRSYVDEVTGQNRFFYDDINAIRMPNYVTRSKIDFLPYSDHYGPMTENNEYGNNNTEYIRTLAQDSWLKDSLEFRNDLTERLMRKVNSEAWQRREAPLGPRQR